MFTYMATINTTLMPLVPLTPAFGGSASFRTSLQDESFDFAQDKSLTILSQSKDGIFNLRP